MKIQKERNEEMTRQMEEIWREHHDPELQAKKKIERKKKEEQKNKEVDLGL